MTGSRAVHVPVLLDEVLEHLLPPASGGRMVDANLGEGGHAEAFLDRYPSLDLTGIEADAEIAAVARERLARFGERFRLIEGWSDEILAAWEGKSPQLILFDLGISSYHLSQARRGFSFLRDEPLDMRLRAGSPVTAADLVARSSAGELERIFRQWGEERYAGRIARRIVQEREARPIAASLHLARVIREAVPASYRHGRIHPATRCFQALRIAVNDELGRLTRALEAAFDLLVGGGRMGVIAFHSLEDRIVKRLLQAKNRSCTCPPESPICQCRGRRELRILTRKPIRAGPAELERNPASRSARLRVVEKCEGE